MKYIQDIKSIIEKYPEIKLAYHYGSRSQENEGPLSDYDFAFFLDEKDKNKRFKTRLHLINDISGVLKTDNVDITILNDTENPYLKYSIIDDGTVFHEEEPFKLLVEPKIMNQYFDFQLTQKHNQL